MIDRLPDDARVTFLTGAGLSVASGIRPFRGPGGIWEEIDPDEWATADVMGRDPAKCWRAHLELARIVARAVPNPAHDAIVALERRLGRGRVTVITQNVDSLHGRAGSRDVVEIHGSLATVRCTDDACRGADGPAPDPATAPERPPACPRCERPIRYGIVLFEEALPLDGERAARDALRDCALFIAVGTSGVVFPAAGYAREAAYAGARTVFVNLEPPVPPNPYFHDVVLGRAEELLPALLLGASAPLKRS